MVKKKIMLAGMWRRIGAHAIDLAAILTLTLPIYFFGVMPNCGDMEKATANLRLMAETKLDSGLFLQYGNDAVDTPYMIGNIGLVELVETTVTYDGTPITIHTLDNLHDYYTEKRSLFFDNLVNLSEDVFKKTIIKVGTEESNIRSFEQNAAGHYEARLIDKEKTSVATSFIKNAYNAAVEELLKCKTISDAQAENNSMALFMIAMVIPVLAGAGLIFTFLIPLFMPYGKTLGKLALHLVVLNGAGYDIKKIQLLPRSIFYIAVEQIGGVLSFGAIYLITYTMTMFARKHRSLHDLVAYTVVADERYSFWFHNRADEEEWINTHKEEYENEAGQEG